MATITSYESLQRPTKSDMLQFSQLLEPLFNSSSEDARREAAAVLSQCTVLPSSVALFIGSQPINIAAIFLTRSAAIDDTTLMIIAKSQGPAHARAIALRENLSPTLVDMLVGLRFKDQPVVTPPAPALVQAKTISHSPISSEMLAKPTAASVREELRAMVMRAQKAPVQSQSQPQPQPRPQPRPLSDLIPKISDVQEALFVRFGRARQPEAFVRVLKDALQSDIFLPERILMDFSGTQLAITLLALGMRYEDISLILRSFYWHLNEVEDRQHRSVALLASLDISDCRQRLAAWLRADGYTQNPKAADPVHEPLLAANRGSDPRAPRHYAFPADTALPSHQAKTLKAG